MPETKAEATVTVATVTKMGIVKLPWALTDWEQYRINLGPGNWADTVVTVDTAWGGGNNGRDHWGWTYEGFAASFRGGVDSLGNFDYFLEAHSGSSPEVGCLFRWVRRGVHGASVAIIQR